MSDLVNRLRDAAEILGRLAKIPERAIYDPSALSKFLREAADGYDALRAALERIAGTKYLNPMDKFHDGDNLREIAREALRGADQPAERHPDTARIDWLETLEGDFYNIDRITSVIGVGFNRLPTLRAAMVEQFLKRLRVLGAVSLTSITMDTVAPAVTTEQPRNRENRMKGDWTLWLPAVSSPVIYVVEVYSYHWLTAALFAFLTVVAAVLIIRDART